MTRACRTIAEPQGPGDIRRWGLFFALALFEVAGGWFLTRHPVGVATVVLVVLATFATVMRPSSARLVTGVALVVLLAGVWTVALDRGFNGDDSRVGFVRWFDSDTTISALQSDPELYRAYVKDSASHGYYRTVADVLMYANVVRSGKVDTGSTTAFRQPLLYVALSRVPTGLGIVLAALVITSLAIAAAYGLGLTFSVPAAALACATILAGHLAATVSAPAVLDTETWAGMLVLVAVALATARSRSPRTVLALHTAAALVTLLAAAIRELSAPMLVLGLLVSLADSGLRKRLIWIPWAAALALFGVVYLVHLKTAAAYLVPVEGMATGFTTWFHPDGSGLSGTVAVIRSASDIAGVTAWLLFAAGIVGSALGPRNRTRRLLLGGVAAGGAVLLLAFRSPATDALTGEAMNTWGAIITPVVLASAPLLLSGMGRALLSGSPLD